MGLLAFIGGAILFILWTMTIIGISGEAPLESNIAITLPFGLILVAGTAWHAWKRKLAWKQILPFIVILIVAFALWWAMLEANERAVERFFEPQREAENALARGCTSLAVDHSCDPSKIGEVAIPDYGTLGDACDFLGYSIPERCAQACGCPAP